MLSNFFRHDDPFDLLSSRIDDIFTDPQELFEDFGFGFEDDLWGCRLPRGRRYGGYNNGLQNLAFSMRRQMQDMQRMFDSIEESLQNPALEDGSDVTNPSQQQQQQLTHSDGTSNNNTAENGLSHLPHSESNSTQNSHPWYKIMKQEKHYIGGSDPSKASYFMKTEVNDNGHVQVKTAEKKPGEDWHVDTREYDEPSQRRLRYEAAQPQGQIEADHPTGEQVQSQRQPQIKQSKEAGSEKALQH